MKQTATVSPFVLVTRPRKRNNLHSASAFMLDENKVKERIEKSGDRYKQVPANTQSIVSLLEDEMANEEKVIDFFARLVECGVRQETAIAMYYCLNDDTLYTAEQLRTFFESDEWQRIMKAAEVLEEKYPELHSAMSDYIKDCASVLLWQTEKLSASTTVLTQYLKRRK